MELAFQVFKMAFYVFYPYLQNSVSCVQIRLNILTFIFILIFNSVKFVFLKGKLQMHLQVVNCCLGTTFMNTQPCLQKKMTVQFVCFAKHIFRKHNSRKCYVCCTACKLSHPQSHVWVG